MAPFNTNRSLYLRLACWQATAWIAGVQAALAWLVVALLLGRAG